MNRKIKKPVVERQRRDRINQLLDELMGAIEPILQKNQLQSGKNVRVEKANILETAVHLLRAEQRKQIMKCGNEGPSKLTQFKSGWDDCNDTVRRFVAKETSGMNKEIAAELLTHLERSLPALHDTQHAIPKYEDVKSSTEKHPENNPKNREDRTTHIWRPYNW